MKKYTVIKNVRIFVGKETKVIEDGAFVVANEEDYKKDQIVFAGTMADLPSLKFNTNDIVSELDLSVGEYTVLPGLINTHTHLEQELPYPPYYVDRYGDAFRALVGYRRAAEAMMCGVTTIRNVGGGAEFDVAVRKAVDMNMLWGPRIVACGSPLIPDAGHGFTLPGAKLCSGTAEFSKALRSQLAARVDQIKLMYTGGLAGAFEGTMDIQMTEEELQTCITIAHNNSKRVVGHLSNDRAIYQAVKMGLDSVEHGYTMSQETVELMAEKGTFYNPTLCVSHGKDYLMALGVPESTLAKQQAAAEEHIASCSRAIKAGVIIGTGTDLCPSDPIGGTTATIREAEFLVEAGMTSAQALQAATYNGARICGIDKITGSLEAGKQGDFIIVEGRPDQNISDLRNIKLIAKGCRLVKSDLPMFRKENFQLLPPGCDLSGGVFLRW